MPSLSLFVTSPPLLSAALAALGPPPPSPPMAPTPVVFVEQGTASLIVPMPLQGWSLAYAQVAAPEPGEAADDAAPTDPEPEAARQEGGNEILVEGTYGPPKSDPAEQFNAESYRITQAVDQALVEPMAYAYRDGLPGPLRDGLGNVVRNLAEPSNALNFLLQGKVGKAFETLGRLAINSTLGLGGLIDIAGKPGIGLPYHRNGFANTMGFYGVGSGPYLYVPITGATTVRDFGGGSLDQALLPYLIGKPFSQIEYIIPYFIINGLDQRLEFDAELTDIRESEDPYGMRRDTYLERRRREIAALKGEVIAEPDAEIDQYDTDDQPDTDQMPLRDPPSPLYEGLSLAEQVQLTAGDVPGGPGGR